MARVVTYGKMPDTMPAGNFRRINFPEAARLDEGTTEGILSRKLSSEGARSLDLPRTISFQYHDDQGHVRSVPVGSIHEVSVNGETQILSMAGFLTDTPDARLAGHLVLTQAMHRSSIDIGDVPAGGYTVTEHGDFFDDDYSLEVEFTDWAVAKNTLVANPAFKNTYSEVEMEAELLAALGDDGPLVVTCPSAVDGHTAVELVAAMSTRPSWDYFNRPESDIPHPIVVDEPDAAGWIPVYGNLAQWRKRHRDAAGNLRHPPRGNDGYANYAKPKAVLTDNGWVAAGPITLLGGHVTLRDAANNIENVWADVKVTDGKHGPWVCGVMRPHIAKDEIEVYRARASQISGYWQGSTLRLICSVVAAGYPVTESEEQDALVASFTPEGEAERAPFPIDALLSFDEITPEAQARLQAWVQSGSKSTTLPSLEIGEHEPGTFVKLEGGDIDVVVADDDFAFRQRQRQRELELADSDV